MSLKILQLWSVQHCSFNGVAQWSDICIRETQGEVPNGNQKNIIFIAVQNDTFPFVLRSHSIFVSTILILVTVHIDL